MGVRRVTRLESAHPFVSRKQSFWCVKCHWSMEHWVRCELTNQSSTDIVKKEVRRTSSDLPWLNYSLTTRNPVQVVSGKCRCASDLPLFSRASSSALTNDDHRGIFQELFMAPLTGQDTLAYIVVYVL